MHKLLCGCVFSFLLGVHLGVALLGHTETLTFTETAKPFSTADKLFYFCLQCTGFPFFHIFATITKGVSLLFYYSTLVGGYEVLTLCGFEFHFPNDQQASFHVLSDCLCIFFEVASIQIFLRWTVFKVFIEFVTILSLFFFFFWPFDTCVILAPRPGIKPAPAALEGKVQSMRPPTKSPIQILCLFLNNSIAHLFSIEFKSSL